MAAPIVAGVAAMMVSLNPGLSASELRARLLQHAGRSRLPVAAGYVDALDSVRSVTTAVGQPSTQRPRLRILRATADRRRTQLQVAVSGSTQAIKRYGIRLDRRARLGHGAARDLHRRAAAARQARPDRRARRVGAPARDRQRRVAQLRAGKRGVTRGRGVGT